MYPQGGGLYKSRARARTVVKLALSLPSHQIKDSPQTTVLNIQFNTSNDLFATANSNGWCLYSINPIALISKKELPDSSLRFVLPLSKTNLVFLVGGPPSPLYPPNRVILWDDHLGAPCAELEFAEEVRGIAAREDRLVVVLLKRVCVFVLGKGGLGLYREGTYPTCENPTGLVALSTAEGSELLAFPGRRVGQVQVVKLPPLPATSVLAAQKADQQLGPPPSHNPLEPTFPATHIIIAHSAPLSALTTTISGALIATTSAKGTLIRLWDPFTGRMVRELRRGTDTAEIFGITFDGPDGERLCVSSDKGTVHVWDLGEEAEARRKKKRAEAETSDSKTKHFGLLKPYLPKYFSSEWSHAHFRLPSPSISTPKRTDKTATPTVEDDVCVCAWVKIEVDRPAPGSLFGPAPTTAAAKAPAPAGRDAPPSPRSTAPHPFRPQRRRESQHATSSPRPSVLGGAAAEHARTPSGSGSGRVSRARSGSSAATTATPQASGDGRATPVQVEGPKYESQLVALTRSGGWYRISMPRVAAEPAEGLGRDSPRNEDSRRSDKGKEKERDKSEASTKENECKLEEMRRFGSKDGW